MVFERLPGPGIEMPASGNHHPQGENTQIDPGKLIGLGHHHRPEAHAPDHQPKAQPQADGHLHQQHLVLLLVLFLLAIVCRIRVFNHPGAIAGTLHRINQRLRITPPLAVAVLSARFIWAWVTPGTDIRAFSIEFTQDAQVAPVTANTTASLSAPAPASVAASVAGSSGLWVSSCALLLQQDVAFFDAQQLPDSASGSAMASAG